jgi:hypothetical protein
MSIILKVHVVRQGRSEIFEHQASDTTTATLEAVHDHYEGQVGVVTAIYGADGTRHYKAPYDAFEV